MLQPGEMSTVAIPLGDKNLMMFDEYDQELKLFKGEFRVMVGSSSRDLRLGGEFIID